MPAKTIKSGTAKMKIIFGRAGKSLIYAPPQPTHSSQPPPRGPRRLRGRQLLIRSTNEPLRESSGASLPRRQVRPVVVRVQSANVRHLCIKKIMGVRKLPFARPAVVVKTKQIRKRPLKVICLVPALMRPSRYRASEQGRGCLKLFVCLLVCFFHGLP